MIVSLARQFFHVVVKDRTWLTLHEKHEYLLHETFKKLLTNILFGEFIAQMTTFAKFLKVISNQKKLEDIETIKIGDDCSAIVLKKLPPKFKDPNCLLSDVALVTLILKCIVCFRSKYKVCYGNNIRLACIHVIMMSSIEFGLLYQYQTTHFLI